MIRAVLDTNVIVQAVIGSPASASARALEALAERRYRWVYSQPVLDELFEVLHLPRIQFRHAMTTAEIIEYVAGISYLGELHAHWEIPLPVVVKDASDRKLLQLALNARCDYLVTNDGRHLLKLKRIVTIPIVTPAKFLKRLR